MAFNHMVLNRLFTPKVFRDLIYGKSDDILYKCLDQYVDDLQFVRNSDIINRLYEYLSKKYRNEYFFKNTLLNRRLLGTHSLNTTTALAELPINKSKADFVLINGHATVFEIKTDLDSFERLNSQLRDYYQAFNKVTVLVSESNYEKLKNILVDTSVGISVLTRRCHISDRKLPSEDNSKLNHITMFKVLRKKEYENILLSHFGYLPHTTQVKYYQECLTMFCEINMIKAYEYMLRELKKRTIREKKLYAGVPYELKYLIYFSNFKEMDYKKLNQFLFEKRGVPNVFSIS